VAAAGAAAASAGAGGVAGADAGPAAGGVSGAAGGAGVVGAAAPAGAVGGGVAAGGGAAGGAGAALCAFAWPDIPTTKASATEQLINRAWLRILCLQVALVWSRFLRQIREPNFDPPSARNLAPLVLRNDFAIVSLPTGETELCPPVA